MGDITWWSAAPPSPDDVPAWVNGVRPGRARVISGLALACGALACVSTTALLLR